MKNITFTLLCCCFIFGYAPAQSCGAGTSGPAACVVGQALSAPGLSPLSQDLPPVYIDSTVNVTIQFQNYDTTSFSGNTVTIDSLQIDTINNLPAGLCWKTNKTNNRFGNKENGCINVSGTVSGTNPCGQYQLYIVVDAWIHGIGDLTLNASQENLFYYVRVKCNPSDSCPRLIDTTGEAAGGNQFEAYTVLCDQGTGYLQPDTFLAIHDINNTGYLNTLSILPNPVSNEAVITFNSNKTGKLTERITNVIGAEVYSNQIQLNLGQNKHLIQKGNLTAGIYIYSLTDGQSVYSKKMVITE